LVLSGSAKWIASPEALKAFLSQSPPLASPPRNRVLMVTPDHFTVQYAINPYMTDEKGKLRQVDRERARAEWQGLVSAYTRLGFDVVCLPGEPDLPDMVFAANQSFPYWDAKEGRAAVVLSRMRSDFRKGEVEVFRRWYEEEGYLVLDPPAHHFEGNGDCLPDPSFPLLWGAYGPRTELSVYSDLIRRTGFSVVPLELVHPDFYHLDTCFSLLGPDTVALLPEALAPDGLRLVRDRFSKVIEIDLAECRGRFAGNCHSPNGKDVLLHPGADRFRGALEKQGFRTHEIPTGEFLKSGGSVFCLKMMCY
jgi:N-dimethylarginine dimethylaminohydrolase